MSRQYSPFSMAANTNTDTTPVAGQNSGTPLTIREALAEARTHVGPDESLMVQFQVWDAPHAANNRICIWDGNTHHDGKSLRQALDKLIAAHTDTSALEFANETEALAAEAHQIIEAQPDPILEIVKTDILNFRADWRVASPSTPTHWEEAQQSFDWYVQNGWLIRTHSHTYDPRNTK